MTKDFIDFCRSMSKGKNFLDVAQTCGKLVAPIFNKEETFNLINAINNPLVFIDMCNYNSELVIGKISMNIGFYLLIQKFNKKKSILYATPESTGKTKFINAFILYKLLTEDYNIVFFNDYGIRHIAALYTNLPDYLKIKPLKEIVSRIYTTKNLDQETYQNVGLVVYDGVPMEEDLDKEKQTIVLNRSINMEQYRKYLMDDKDNRGTFEYLGMNFSFKDIGLGKEYYKKMKAKYKNDVDKLYDNVLY